MADHAAKVAGVEAERTQPALATTRFSRLRLRTRRVAQDELIAHELHPGGSFAELSGARLAADLGGQVVRQQLVLLACC